MFQEQIILLFFLTAASLFHESIAERSENILGGWPAKPGEFPYQVSLRVNGHHICGGAIISNLHILTAAHCVEHIKYPYKYSTIVSGSNQLKNGGQFHKICKITSHPKYKPGPEYLWHNDIAIITLTSPITFNSLQNKIDLPRGNLNRRSSGVVAGWGLILLAIRIPPDNLQKLTTTIYPFSICQEYFTNIIHREQICAIQARGKGVCSGDSGGPLVVNGEVVGITSWVVPCGKGYPDVYTNVFLYNDFIRSEMKTCSRH